MNYDSQGYDEFKGWLFDNGWHKGRFTADTWGHFQFWINGGDVIITQYFKNIGAWDVFVQACKNNTISGVKEAVTRLKGSAA